MFLCIHEYNNFVFVMNHFVWGSLSRPFLVFILAYLYFILSFLHLPVHPIGCNLKSLRMAREAQLLVTVSSGRVRSVGMFKAKSCKVIKGTDYPFIRVEEYSPYDSKKERWYCTPVEPPSDLG